MPFSPKLLRIVRRVLLILAILGTVVAVIIAIENWRGNRAWHQYAAEQTAKGVNLTELPQPSSLPAESNFMKTPTLDRFLWESSGSAALQEFFTRNNIPTLAPSKGFGWQHGRTLDFKSYIERYGYAEAKKTENSSFTAETLFTLQKPMTGVFEELRLAARVRSESQLARKSSINRTDPFSSAFASFQFVRALVIAQSAHACAALSTDQPEVALYDTLAVLKFSRGLAEAPDPILVETMIGTVSFGYALQPTWEGLQKRSWNEDQLALLAQELARADLVNSLDRSLQTERLAANVMMDQLNWRKNMPFDVIKQFKTLAWFLYFPSGWVQQNKVRSNQWSDQIHEALTSRGTAAFLAKLQHIDDSAKELGGPLSPYTSIVSIIIPAHKRIAENVIQKQSLLNVAITACALERHWLAHGNYPERLTELVPTYLDKVPLDIIDGQPLHYRRTDNGKFALYSVGLDGKDDSGKPAKSNNADETGDWAWPQPAASGP